jgi:hypothetical protein
MGCVEKKLLTQGQVPVRAWGSEFLERKKEPLAKANRLAKGLNTGSRVGMGSAGGLWFGGIGVCVFRVVGRNTLAFLKMCHVAQRCYIVRREGEVANTRAIAHVQRESQMCSPGRATGA